MNANVHPVQTSITILSRTGDRRHFEPNRIERAILGAAMEVFPGTDSMEQNRKFASECAQMVVKKIELRLTRVVSVEEIQDLVELTLMDVHKEIAKAFIVYRARKAEGRVNQATLKPKCVAGPNGRYEYEPRVFCEEILPILVSHGVEDAREHANSVAIQVHRDIYDGVSEKDFLASVVNAIRTRVEFEPAFTFVAAHLMLEQINVEVQRTIGLHFSITPPGLPSLFKYYIEMGVCLGILDPRMATNFDIDALSGYIQSDRDQLFNLIGVQTLYDRYLLKTKNGERYETPQMMFMRVAMGIALNEADPTLRAKEYYEVLSNFDYMTSTPTLFNSGTVRPQMSSCYISTIPDDLLGIYGGITNNALLSKYAGGLGNDWTRVRAMGSHIKGTNGNSQGVVPFLKVVNDTAVAVNQGGKRKGAVCAYLETWHADIEDFLDLRKNTGDDRRRTHDMNTANWIPDLFMHRMINDQLWSLFSPDEVPELHELYGHRFMARYEEYEAMGRRGELRVFKQVPAKSLWRKMLQMAFETGHPWITFKDPCNLRSPQQHVGVVHSSNLCTEITLNTSDDEIAVCNLGSVNLANHVVGEGLDREKLAKTVRIAMRMLDNVIDINFYNVPQARSANLRHRPVGLGLMGFHDSLYKLRIPYASPMAVKFADQSMEIISYFAFDASADLARERGSYETFAGSDWSRGHIPLTSLASLEVDRMACGINVDGLKCLIWNEGSSSGECDWESLREKVRGGMRNSNCLAIAPTATIANICGCSQSIDPTYQNLYVKSNLSGEFTVLNQYLVDELKSLGLWDRKMVNDLKFFDGSVQSIEGIPDDVKQMFKTAFEIEPSWLIECAARRQKWIDQAQSLNLYMSGASGKKLDAMYRLAWGRGLKTTYYLRTLAATSTEKSTGITGALNAVSSQPVSQSTKVCSIDNPDCESCQ